MKYLSTFHSANRAGNTLVLAMAALVFCAGLTFALIDRVTGDMRLESHREARENVHGAANSALNYLYDYATNTNKTLLDSATIPVRDKATVPSLTATDLAASGNPLLNNALFSTVSINNLSCPGLVKLSSEGIKVGVGIFYANNTATQTVGSTTTTAKVYRLVAIAEYGTRGSKHYAVHTAEMLLNRRVAVTAGSPISTQITVPFPGGLFCENPLALGGNIGFNAWDSGGTGIACPYIGNKNFSKAPTYNGALVGSNGTVSIGGSASVRANAAGPPVGTTSNANKEAPDMTFSVPGTTSDPKASAAWAGAITLTSGNVYSASSVNGATLTIHRTSNAASTEWTKLYVSGPFLANPLVFTKAAGVTANGRLMVYQNDYNDASHAADNYNGNTSVGVLNDPSSFVMFSLYSGELTLNGNAQYGGVLIAPNATFKLNGTFDFFGSLFIKGVTNANGTFNLHYDMQLSNKSMPVDIVTPVPPTTITTDSVLAWRTY